jgi:hypothetical protein
MPELSLSSIAAAATATSILFGSVIWRHVIDARGRARRDESAWKDVYDWLTEEQVISIDILVFQQHGELWRTYVTAQPKKQHITLDEVALLARNVMRFPSAVAVTITKHAL